MDYKSSQSPPRGWVITTLDQVALWGSGGTPSRKNPEFYKGTIPWVKTGELGPKYIRSSGELITQEAIQRSSAKVFPAGSVGIAMYGATIGKLSIWASDLSTNQACAVAQPHQELLHSEFLYYFLLSQKHSLIERGKGGAQPNISQGILRTYLIWLPPLREQLRIVAKIEELFSELDKGIESLKTAQAQLKVYRQAVLKHAFEGKLTAQWREGNKDKLETPEQLLARIRQEREVRYEQQLKEWKAAVKKWEGNGKRGKRPRKPRTPNPTKNSFKDFAAESNHLPFGWTWTTIGSLFDVVSGATPKGLEQAKGDGTPFYKVSDMNALGNETRMDSATIYLSETERNDLGLTAYPRGTIIFPKRGGAILTNKKRLLSRLSCFDLNTMGVINSLASISTEYLWHWFQSLDLAKIYDGSNVPQINNKNVEPLLFPICSIEEQREVSSILEKVLSLVDETEADISRELWKAETLRQSVLKKAFSGQLVPQDPHDEPASVLLDRIRAEREKAVKNNHARKTKRRRTTV